MSHADQLIEIATELAMDAKDNLADLQRKLSAIETAKVEIEARLHTAKHALERLSSFVSIRGNDLQCPRCWINKEVIASLRPASARASCCDYRSIDECLRHEIADQGTVVASLKRRRLHHHYGDHLFFGVDPKSRAPYASPA